MKTFMTYLEKKENLKQQALKLPSKGYEGEYVFKKGKISSGGYVIIFSLCNVHTAIKKDEEDLQDFLEELKTICDREPLKGQLKLATKNYIKAREENLGDWNNCWNNGRFI